MNKRIKELAQESGLYIAYDNKEVTDKELEFFAEMIVRECLMKVNGAKIRNESYDELISRITVDFGVE
jgi:hypothetical protein